MTYSCGTHNFLTFSTTMPKNTIYFIRQSYVAILFFVVVVGFACEIRFYYYHGKYIYHNNLEAYYKQPFLSSLQEKECCMAKKRAIQEERERKRERVHEHQGGRTVLLHESRNESIKTGKKIPGFSPSTWTAIPSSVTGEEAWAHAASAGSWAFPRPHQTSRDSPVNLSTPII